MRFMVLGDLLNLNINGNYIIPEIWNKWGCGSGGDSGGWAWTQFESLDGKTRWQTYLEALCRDLGVAQ